MAELLSPAGGWDSLVAAVQSGADAVYMGFGAYNARRSAKNFTEEEFAQAVRYCHLRGVKVYLTLNTLLTDRELPGAAELLHKASRLGADAVLNPGLGGVELARRRQPELPLHASTQMSLHTLGAHAGRQSWALPVWCWPVSCPGRDIAAICRDCPAEVEVFAHGALCMCYSGQCALSAVIGGRSGNRGTCAQPCRRPMGSMPRRREPSSEPEGRQPLPLSTGAGGHGGGVPEAGGAHEAAGVRGGHHLHLPAAAG